MKNLNGFALSFEDAVQRARYVKELCYVASAEFKKALAGRSALYCVPIGSADYEKARYWHDLIISTRDDCLTLVDYLRKNFTIRYYREIQDRELHIPIFEVL